jgi:hypothetical protein
VDPFPISPKNIAWFQGKLKIKGKKGLKATGFSGDTDTKEMKRYRI